MSPVTSTNTKLSDSGLNALRVKVLVQCPKIQLYDGTRHIQKALQALGFTGTEHVEDLVIFTETYWLLDQMEIDLGLASKVSIQDLAEKLQVFQSVPVTSNAEFIFFTIEDWWD